MQFKIMTVYSENRMTAINIIWEGLVAGKMQTCVMSKHVVCTVTSKIKQLHILQLSFTFCIMTVTHLYRFTVEGLTLLPNVLASHNVMVVPNANLCDLVHSKFKKSI
jgi:ribosome biogenesis protein Nip4